MKSYSAKEIYNLLKTVDKYVWIEVKKKVWQIVVSYGNLVQKGKTLDATYYVLNENIGQKDDISPTTVTEKVTETQKQILKILKSNPHITQTELAELVGISRVHINKNMAKLRDMNLITRIGSDKGWHWEIFE